MQKIIDAQPGPSRFDLSTACLELGKIVVRIATGYYTHHYLSLQPATHLAPPNELIALTANQAVTHTDPNDQLAALATNVAPQNALDHFARFGLVAGSQEVVGKLLDLMAPKPNNDAKFWRNVHEKVRETTRDFVNNLDPIDVDAVNEIHNKIEQSLNLIEKGSEPHTAPKTLSQVYEYLIILLAGHLGKPRKMFNYLTAVDKIELKAFLEAVGEDALFFKVAIYSIIGRSVAPQPSTEDEDKEITGLQILISGEPGIRKSKLAKRLGKIFRTKPIDFDTEAKKETSALVKDSPTYDFQSRPGAMDTAAADNPLEDAVIGTGYLNPIIYADELQGANHIMQRDTRKHAQQKRLFDPSRGEHNLFRHTIVISTTNTLPNDLDAAIKDRFLIIRLSPPTKKMQEEHRAARRAKWKSAEEAEQDWSYEEEDEPVETDQDASSKNEDRIILFNQSFPIAREFAESLDPKIASIPGNSTRLRNTINDILLHWQSVECALYGRDARVDPNDAISVINKIVEWNCSAPNPAPPIVS